MGKQGVPRRPALRTPEERNKLVEQYRYLPSHIYKKLARRYRQVRKQSSKVMDAGFDKLIRAGDLWDEAGGASFMTYAYTSIEREMLRAAFYKPLRRVVTRSFTEEERRKWNGRINETHVRETGELVSLFLTWLRPAERECVRGHLIEGEKFESLAERLGMTPAQVRDAQYQGLRRIRRIVNAKMARSGSAVPGVW